MEPGRLPDSMAAVEISTPGPPEVLKIARRPVPRPGAGEALIRVRAAGVNYPDLLQRQGTYPPPPGASDIPGLEVAGEVAAVGDDVGARVFATAGSAQKCGVCESLGAEKAIDYRREDFVAVIRERTAGRGVDVILDILGGDELPRNLECLAVDGRLVQIAFLKGAKAEVNLAPILQRRLTLTGSTLRPRSVEEKGAIAWALRGSVWPMLEHGTVRPVIHATFPLAQAADAHRLMESRQHVGKIVLTV